MKTNEMTTEQMMMALKALDNQCAICFSEITNQWYVNGRWEINDGHFLTSPTVHEDTAVMAVRGMFLRLADVAGPETIVIDATSGTRKEYRWIGFMWKEIPRCESQGHKD